MLLAKYTTRQKKTEINWGMRVQLKILDKLNKHVDLVLIPFGRVLSVVGST